MAVFALKHVIDHYRSQSSPVYLCYIDASKAFDRINHWILFDKLLNRGMPNIVVRLLITWYSHQRFIVKWGNALSEYFNVTNGVRQGGILSPHLFNTYIDDLSYALTKSQVGCFINTVCVNHIVYADDTVIIAPTPDSLQILLNICDIFAAEHDMLYNVKKTKCMCFKPKLFHDIVIPDIKLNGNAIDFVPSHKYLGYYMSESFTDDKDIVRQMRSIYAKGNSLIHKFKFCSPDVKAQLFKSYCGAFYCTTLWSNYKKETLMKLRVAYKRIFRSLFSIKYGSSITLLMLQNKCDPLDVILRKLVCGFRERLSNSCNSVIAAIINSIFYRSSALTQKWNNVLFRLSP